MISIKSQRSVPAFHRKMHILKFMLAAVEVLQGGCDVDDALPSKRTAAVGGDNG